MAKPYLKFGSPRRCRSGMRIKMNLFQKMTSKRGRRVRMISLLIILLLVAAMVLTSLLYAVV